MTQTDPELQKIEDDIDSIWQDVKGTPVVLHILQHIKNNGALFLFEKGFVAGVKYETANRLRRSGVSEQAIAAARGSE